jgi:hypothetical protein
LIAGGGVGPASKQVTVALTLSEQSPSETLSVTVAGPAAVQVKVERAVVAPSSIPLELVQL